jgi:hypothetical protein
MYDIAEVIEIPIDEFLKMLPAPGHRDSERRALNATHLHKLVPEHLEVEVAEYKQADGMLVRRRMTGNTRAQVWKCGLSDTKPDKVRARLYRMKTEDEARERMLRHDSPEAAWSASDQLHRAMNMTFEDGWRPRSPALRGGRFISAVRAVDALVKHSRWSPDLGTKVELIMSDWKAEFQKLDDITDRPLADGIAMRKPFTWGFLAGFLLLLRFCNEGLVDEFCSKVLSDRGEKLDGEYDGVQALIENLGRGKNAGSKDHQQKLINCVLGAFDRHEQKTLAPNAVAAIRKTDALDWTNRQRKQKQEYDRTTRIDAAE